MKQSPTTPAIRTPADLSAALKDLAAWTVRLADELDRLAEDTGTPYEREEFVQSIEHYIQAVHHQREWMAQHLKHAHIFAALLRQQD